MPRSRVYDPDAVLFGAIIRQHREQRGWTKKKLATRAALTPNYLGILEAGGNVPSLTTVLELCEVLGVDVGEVMRQLVTARNTPKRRIATTPAAEDPEVVPVNGT